MANWWDKQLRIVQFNLQMKDTMKMDPEKIAAETADMGSDTVVINLSDSVVWYQTKVQHCKINPYLPKDRDLFGELVEAFHKRNIRVISRGAFMGLEEEVYYQHPEWVKRDAEGRPRMLGNERPGEWYRLYSPCPMGDFVFDCEYNITLEAFKKYDIDGAFFCSGSVTRGVCRCDRCKKLYRETVGEEMPDDEQKLSPKWQELLNQKMRGMKDGILKVRPDIPYLRYYWPFDVDIGVGWTEPADNIEKIALQGNTLCTEAQDVLSLGTKKLPNWNTPALRMKMGRTKADFPPPVGIIHACPGMDWRHACMPEAEFLYWASQVPANGGSYWTTFTGFCDTIPDKRMFGTVRKLNRMIEKIEQPMQGAHSDVNVMLLSDGGVYVQGWAEALMNAHIDFDMLAEYQVEKERLAGYAVVIVPKNFRYTKERADAIRDYAQSGGKVIIEGTSEVGLSQIRDMLPFEGDIVSSEELEATYLRIEDSALLLKKLIGDCPLVPLRGKVGFTHPKEGAEVLATWVPPFSAAATAGFPPERASLPKERTDIPLAAVGEYGKGTVLFLSYEPSRLIIEYALRDMFTVIDGYVSGLLGEEKKVRTDAPRRVMMTAFEKENLKMLHFINGVGQRPLQECIPIGAFNVSVKLNGKKAQKVTMAISGAHAEWSQEGDELKIRVPGLEVWDTVLIELT